MIFKQASDIKEVDRPWQADIDRLQQTLQEVLSNVSNVPGAEFSGGTPDSRTPENVHQLPNCTNYKDRIRTDLEAFATATVSEVTRLAERQTRLALAALQTEASGQVDQVARELREKLQGQFEPGHFDIGITQQTQDRVAELVQRRTDEFARWVWLMCKGTGTSIPIQIEKLMEPYVDEATGRFLQSFRQRFDDQLAEQEQTAQGRLQGALSLLEQRMNELEQAAKRICEQSAESIAGAAAGRVSSVADEAARNFEKRVAEQFESDLLLFRSRLEKTAESLQQTMQQREEQKANDLNGRIAILESEIEDKVLFQIGGRIEQTAANAIESSIQHLHHQADDTLDHSKAELKGFLELQMEEARVRINQLAKSVNENLSQEAERRADLLKKLDQEITGLRDTSIAVSKDQLAALVQGTLEIMKDRITQISTAQLEEIDKLLRGSREKETSQYQLQLREINGAWQSNLLQRVQAEAQDAAAKIASEVKVNADSVMQEFSDKVDASAVLLRNETAQATARIESTVKNSLDAYEKQLSQIAGSRLEEHRRVIRKSLADLQTRLEQSAQILRQEIAGPLGADNREPFSSERTEPPKAQSSF
ncbi:MAG TPA: hypothetical protein VFZ27_15465 [Terriglobia bacterium]|nr:hypothetical protein [Terriglobia bacterium]